MNLKEAMDRIEQLERRVRELEARPAQHVHHHWGGLPPTYGPTYVPQQPNIQPAPWNPPWHVTCGASIGGGSSN